LMRGAVVRAVRRMWSGQGGFVSFALGVATTPLATIFASLVRLRNWLYDRGFLRVHESGIAVVSVGNLAVGGTGKTPVAGWMVRILLEEGWSPALVARGYGADELKLHRRWNPTVPVIAASRRIDGVRKARAEGADIVVLDDAFQHRSIHRDIDIVLLSPAQPLPARLLPRGPFREPLAGLARADLVVVTGKGGEERRATETLAEDLRARSPGPPVEILALNAGEWESLEGGAAEGLPDGHPLVVTSIAEPAAFLGLVCERTGGILGHLEFRDHHDFQETDAGAITRAAGASWVATTEKDAVKLVEFRELLPEVRVLPLVVAGSAGIRDNVLESLAQRSRER